MQTITGLKHKAVSIIENTFTKTGTVLDVRTWGNNTFYEIDLHLPQANMEKWQKVLHINCRVAPMTFRDYTRAGWDSETHTCTLYIHAAHVGLGSRWVRALRKGDNISYLNIESTHHQPAKGSKIVFLGDQSAIGHFMALQQLSGTSVEVGGVMVMDTAEYGETFEDYFPALNMLTIPDYYAMESISTLLNKNHFSENDIFYLAGNSYMVHDLRRLLRQAGYDSKQIRTQGFWH